MPLSSLAGWIGLALLPLAAVLGFVLRRTAAGTLMRRLRPHFILGYATLALALLHLALSADAMRFADATGIWSATLAIAGMGVQTFLGASLQSPGVYRKPLRRWHVVLFWLIAAASIIHVVLNGGFMPGASD